MDNESKLSDNFLNKCEKFDQVCRVCLTENTEHSKCVFDVNESSCIASMLMLCTRVQIACQDGLPDIICSQCFGDLEAANSFRLRCELSDSLLRKLCSDTGQRNAPEPEENIPEILNSVVKEEVACEQWIKSEVENDRDSDLQYDPLIENISDPKPKIQRLKNSQTLYKYKKKIKTSDGLRSTKRAKQENKCFVCKICKKPLSTNYSLEHHMHSAHGKDKTLDFANITGYGKNKLFHCTECPYTAPRRQYLLYHSRTHTGERPYKCDECEACFTQPGGLSTHKRLHSDKMYFTCPECGKQFKLKYVLERHRLVHSDGTHFCKICSKALKTKRTLETHMKRHLNIRDYNCEQCGRTFISVVDLINHAKLHDDTKRFECHICAYKAKQKRLLIIHMRHHTGEKKFKCDHCEYLAYDKCSLKKHLIKHSQERNYSCPVCAQTFLHSVHVNRHMMRIHKTKYKVGDHTDNRIIK